MGKCSLYVSFLPVLGLVILPVQARWDGSVRPPCAACLVVILGPDGGELLPATLNGLRIAVDVEAGREPSAAPLAAAVRRRDGRPLLLIRGVPRENPAGGDQLEAAVADLREAGLPDGDGIVALKRWLASARGTAPRLRLGVALPDLPAAAMIARELAPYLDFVVATDQAGSADLQWWREGPVLRDAHAALDITRSISAETIMVRVEQPARAAVIADLAAAMPFLPAGLIDAPGVAVSCTAGPAEVWTRVPGAAAERPIDYVVWAPSCPPSGLHVPPPLSTTARIALSTGDLLASLSSPSGERFMSGVRVVAQRTLSVEEVIARHQAAVARRKAVIQTMISSGTMTLTFEAPGFTGPVTVTSESVSYESAGQIEIEQRSILVNGLDFTRRGVPRLPLIEPERVASPPLAIALGGAYRYELRGTAALGAVRCHVVSFEPVDRANSSFEGTAWIDVETFGLVRLAARQTALRGPIVSSEQVEQFRLDAGFWLPVRVHVRQLYEGAAHRTPIERVVVFARHEINPVDFEDRRASAYQSSAVMLRDTPDGYRYVRHRGNAGQGPRGQASMGQEPFDRGNSVKALILGAMVDPNIRQPLPFAGLSYADFDLLGTGAQFAALFGGTYGQLAVAVPSVGGSRWQLGGRLFGLAVSYNDRAFEGGRERYEQNIRQRPASGSVWVARSVSPRLALRAAYELDFTAFTRADTTSADFRLPSHQVVHGLRLAAEAQRNGWRVSAWWNPAVRTGWRAWGGPDSTYDARQHDFQRFGASVARTEVLSGALVVRGEAGWVGGTDLDRFSRFAFGAFENRLRGFPAAMIRYDRGAVVRGSAAWSLGPRLRLDGFVDAAWVHDPGLAAGVTQLTGLGTAVEVPAPFGSLLAAEWGYGLQGQRARGGRGTHVIRITAYKFF